MAFVIFAEFVYGFQRYPTVSKSFQLATLGQLFPNVSKGLNVFSVSFENSTLSIKCHVAAGIDTG